MHKMFITTLIELNPKLEITKMFISGKIDKLCHIPTIEYYIQLGKGWATGPCSNVDKCHWKPETSETSWVHMKFKIRQNQEEMIEVRITVNFFARNDDWEESTGSLLVYSECSISWSESC